MQESRYVMQAFDEQTWSILDSETNKVYALALTELANFRVHIALAEVSLNSHTARYMMYLREILGVHLQVSDQNVGRDVLTYVLQELQLGADIANPVEMAIRLSADLHGQPIEWPVSPSH